MLFSYSRIYCAVAMALCASGTQAEMLSNEKVQSHENVEIRTLNPVILQAKSNIQVGQSKYTKEDLENIPNTQKNITDFLKVNPNVQFNNNALAAGKLGDLAASDVSIHGALFYDNKFLLNNVNIGNALNPADDKDGTGIESIDGGSLTATVNTDLLCGIEVLDSSVSAEYGEFTGGVIQAKTCIPNTAVGKVHGSLAYDYSSSDWTKYHFVDAEEFDAFADNDNAKYQKNFVKQGLSSTVYGKPTERLGLSLSASRRWSEIGLVSSYAAQEPANQTRQIDNFSGNLSYDFDDKNQLKLGLYYQEESNNKHNPSLANSSFQSQSENLALDFELKHDLEYAVLTQNLVLQSQNRARDSASTSMLAWNTSPDKNWSTQLSSTEGGYGDLEMSQDNWEYNLKSNFKDFELGGLIHHFKAGVGYGHYQADWKRLEHAYMYYLPSKSNGGLGTNTCTLADGSLDPYCDLSYSNGTVSGQYLARRRHYAEGEIEVQQDRWFSYLEDEMQLDQWLKLRFGLRQDYDSLSKKNNVAPRSLLQVLPFSNERLNLSVGWNRYYSNNAFSYALQDGKNALTSEERRNSLEDAWKVSNANAASSNIQRTQLDVAYSDESLFAISSVLGNWRSQLKFVNRDYKDQIRKDKIADTASDYQYTNNGQSSAKTYTLQIDNIIPINALQAKNSFSLAVDYSQIKRNFNDYDDSMYNEQRYVEYDGKIISQLDMPADNFARPLTVRAVWNMKFDHTPLTLTHFLRYRSAYDVMEKSTIAKNDRYEYNGEIIQSRYNPERLSAAFTWDTRATYAMKIGRDYALNLGLTVNNVFNRHNKYYEQSASRILSETGRQFVADVQFKF